MLADNSYGEPVIKNSRFVNNRNGLSLRGSIINKEKVINLDVSNNENYGIVSSSDTRGNTGEIWFEDNRVNEYIQIPYDKCSSKECNSNIPHTKERIQEFNNKNPVEKNRNFKYEY